MTDTLSSIMNKVSYLARKSQAVHENTMIEMYQRRLQSELTLQTRRFLLIALGVWAGVTAAILIPLALASLLSA